MKTLAAVAISFAAATTFAAPQVSVVRAPHGIVQPIGAAAEHDDFDLANSGPDPAAITIQGTKQFFTIAPAQFVLDPGAKRTITIQPAVSAAGVYDGAANVFVTGFKDPITVPVRLLIGNKPAGLVTPVAQTSTIILSPPAGQPHSAAGNVRNSGNVGMQGLLVADVPWIVPSPSLLNVAPGTNGQMPFDVDPTQRADGATLPLGAELGTLSMIYLKGTANTLNAEDTPSVSVPVIDIQKVAVVPSTPPGLASGESAVFLPAITDLGGYFTDVFLSNRGTSGVSNLRLFYNAAGASPASSLLANIALFPTGSSAWFPFSPSSIFNVTNQLGGIQVRNSAVGNVSVSAIRGVTQTDGNKYLTAMPTMSSDASIGAGERLLFAGIEKSATARTDVVVQETAGLAGAYTIDFFDAGGATLAPNRTGSLLPFGTFTVSDAAPAGARSARLTNSGGGGSRVTGFALVTDATTADEWTVVASPAASDLIVPIPSLTGAPASTFDVYVTNAATTPTPVTITTKPEPPRRRVATLTPASATATLAAGETRKFTITSAPLGYVRVHAPAGTISASGRLTSTVSGRAGSFGTGVPAVATTLGIGAGTVKRFSRAADGAGVAPPPTLLLIESSGQPVTAKVTIRFNFPAGSTVAGQVSSSKTYALAPAQLLTVSDVARSILGPARDTLGVIYNVLVDVEVVDGGGKVLSFVQTMDPSGDITLSAD